jgi:hypothetical protein
MRQDEFSLPTSATLDATTELRIHNTRLWTEIDALKLILEAERTRANGMRIDLERWAAQVERLALSRPAMPTTPIRRGWWRFSRRAG